MVQHLSGLDASFLHFETPETPMHVGALAMLDLPAGYDGDYYEAVKQMIGDRLHLAPILTRKLAQMPFELAEPVWIEDDSVDLDYHVRSVVLRRPGSVDQLLRSVARLHSSLLDRSRPLWEMYVFEGLKGDKVAFYFKAHHAGIDGKSGMAMAKVIFDSSAEIREVRRPRRRYHQTPSGYQLGVAELLQAAAANTARQYRLLRELAPKAASALVAAGNVLSHQQAAPGERPLTLGVAPHTIFNDSITNQRSFSTLSLPFARLREAGRRLGGTVNTVVMAMCGEALRRFLQEHDALPKEALITAVPVSLRAEGDSAMNNQVSAVRVDLATDIEDLGERFRYIHNSSEAAKAVVRELTPVLTVDMPLTGAPWIMTSLASLYGRSNLARRMPPMANVMISNVPGPTHTLYIAGARMTAYYPVSIPYHGSALNITVHSYAGSMDFGLIACRRVLSQEESGELARLLEEALEAIEALPAQVVDEDKAAEKPASKPADKPPKAVAGAAATRKRPTTKRAPRKAVPG